MATFRDQGEISNIYQFGSYEWVYARDGSETFPHVAEAFGLCLVPANDEGNKMAQWLLNINGQVVPRGYLRRLQADELISDVEISKRAAFDAQIKIIHGNSFTVPATEHTKNPQYLWDEEDRPIPIPEADTMDEKGTPLSPISIADTLIHAEFVLPCGESDNFAKVIIRSLGVNGKVIGNQN